MWHLKVILCTFVVLYVRRWGSHGEEEHWLCLGFSFSFKVFSRAVIHTRRKRVKYCVSLYSLPSALPNYIWIIRPLGFPGAASGKEFTCADAGDRRDMGSVPGLGRSPGGGHGNPSQYSCLENPMDKGAWWATVHRVTESQTWLKRLSMHTHLGP